MLREDFAALAAIVAEEADSARRDGLVDILDKTIEHAKSFDLIAVFNAEIDEFEVGRVLLFQDFIAANTGILPQPVKTMAHCIKVFFDLGEGWRSKREHIIGLFGSESYRALCKGLDLSYVQFAGQLFPPQSTRR